MPRTERTLEQTIIDRLMQNIHPKTCHGRLGEQVQVESQGLSTWDPNHSPICMHGYVQRPNFRVYAEVSKLPKFVHI